MRKTAFAAMAALALGFVAEALALGAARSTGAWKEAFGLQLQTLEAAERADQTKGKFRRHHLGLLSSCQIADF